MCRSHYRPPSRRPRRASDCPAEDACFIVRPPTADEHVFFGFCEHLGLWRIKAPPFDAHGAIDPIPGIEGFYEALADAALQVEEDRPDLSDWLRSLLDHSDA